MEGIIKCGDCMKGAPYTRCCKTICGERDFCLNCNSEARGGPECPNDDKYVEKNSERNIER